MQQMPPLPVRLNVELANNFLPKAVANGVCQVPYMAAPMHSEPRVHAPIHSCTHDTASCQPPCREGMLLMLEASVCLKPWLGNDFRASKLCAGMPSMPVMSQQASAAMPQASMPYGAVSAPAPAFAAPSMAPHPFANGMSAPAAPAAAASIGLPTSMPTAVRFSDTV